MKKHNWKKRYYTAMAMGARTITETYCCDCGTIHLPRKEDEECDPEWDDKLDLEMARHITDNIYYSPKRGYFTR